MIWKKMNRTCENFQIISISMYFNLFEFWFELITQPNLLSRIISQFWISLAFKFVYELNDLIKQTDFSRKTAVVLLIFNIPVYVTVTKINIENMKHRLSNRTPLTFVNFELPNRFINMAGSISAPTYIRHTNKEQC